MSASYNKHVVIFKSVTDSKNYKNDIYYQTFQSAGFHVTLIPVIDFEFVNLNELLKKLKERNDYEGIIFSSPRCVKAVKLAIGHDKDLINKWKSLKNYVVGEATGSVARELGFIVTGEEAGDSNSLADVISKGKYSKPFLYPVGSLNQKNFSFKLKQNNINLDEQLIYVTKPHPHLNESIREMMGQVTDPSSPVYFIFFSPSGVEYSLPFLRKSRFDLQFVKFVAIGPSTEAELVKNRCQVDKTSLKPNPQSLLEAVKSLENGQSSHNSKVSGT